MIFKSQFFCSLKRHINQNYEEMLCMSEYESISNFKLFHCSVLDIGDTSYEALHKYPGKHGGTVIKYKIDLENSCERPAA